MAVSWWKKMMQVSCHPMAEIYAGTVDDCLVQLSGQPLKARKLIPGKPMCQRLEHQSHVRLLTRPAYDLGVWFRDAECIQEFLGECRPACCCHGKDGSIRRDS